MEKKEILRKSNEESNRVTKEAIQTALLFLMREKPLEKITITELAKMSGVSRTAFYRNYTSKEDVLDEIGNLFLDRLRESFLSTKYQSCHRQWYYDFFRDIKENAEIFRILLQVHLMRNLVDDIDFLLEKWNLLEHSPEKKYAVLAWKGAFSSILVRWFQDGMKESLDFMADFCIKLFERE